ncbi:MAG: ComEC/Rec2 family competence protein [Specibacter sp.]
MKPRDPRWEHFARAAVVDARRDPGDDARLGAVVDARRDPGDDAPSLRGRYPGRRQLPQLRRFLGRRQILRRGSLARLAKGRGTPAPKVPRRRADLRLVPAVAATWAGAAVAVGLPWTFSAVGSVLCLTLAVAAFLVLWHGRSSWNGAGRAPVLARTADSPRGSGFNATGAVASTVLAAAVCLGTLLLAVALDQNGRQNQPLAKAVSRGEQLSLTMQVSSVPRPVAAPGGGKQVVFDAVVIGATAHGRRLAGHVDVRVVAGGPWGSVPQGAVVSTSGTVSEAGLAERVAGYLRPATVPLNLHLPRGAGPQAFRSAWADAARRVWSGPAPDAAALLPGMVMGDRSRVDPILDEAMKTVGLTHLTAVSGENCTLVLAALMLGLRTVHAPRAVAGMLAVGGLAAFVAVVGPDPSVLRAAVMGAIGCVAMLSGRPKRVGALLSVSIVVLLVADPWLSLDYAFILSVLATLGLHLVGRRLAFWLGLRLPMWLAQALAIPVAAQLFCAPVIVLLQARFTPYTVPANVLAAPVVALVTTVGTLGLAVGPLLPAVATGCAALGGLGALWVATIARWFSALPAASLPWPSGVKGAVLMAVANAAVLGALVILVEHNKVVPVLQRHRARLSPRWRPLFGFGSFAAIMAVGAGLWTAAVLGP